MIIIKVLEPHPVSRFGLQQLISSSLPHASVKGLDYDALYSAGNSDTKCDLVLLSISSDGQFTEQLEAVKRVCDPNAILLLGNADALNLQSLFTHPIVRGVINKDAISELLLASVRLVLAGGTCFPALPNHGTTQNPLLTLDDPIKRTPESLCNAERPAECGEAKMLGLTPRQYEVLVLLAKGHPLKAVGRRLNISAATAKAHTESLYRRLNVNNCSAAVYEAVSRGATLGWSNVTAA